MKITKEYLQQIIKEEILKETLTPKAQELIKKRDAANAAAAEAAKKCPRCSGSGVIVVQGAQRRYPGGTYDFVETDPDYEDICPSCEGTGVTTQKKKF